MIDLELPLNKRTKLYRFFEILPGFLSYGMVILLFVLAMLSPLAAAVYLLLLIITMFVKASGIAFRSIMGHRRLVRAQCINWHARLAELEYPVRSYHAIVGVSSSGFEYDTHKENLRLVAADPSAFPKPSTLYQMVIIAAYNEAYDVLQPTIESVRHAHYNNQQTILVLAYEERGGVGIAETAKRLRNEYSGVFLSFETIMRPDGLSDEIPSGKGPILPLPGTE